MEDPTTDDAVNSGGGIDLDGLGDVMGMGGLWGLLDKLGLSTGWAKGLFTAGISSLLLIGVICLILRCRGGLQCPARLHRGRRSTRAFDQTAPSVIKAAPSISETAAAAVPVAAPAICASKLSPPVRPPLPIVAARQCAT